MVLLGDLNARVSNGLARAIVRPLELHILPVSFDILFLSGLHSFCSHAQVLKTTHVPPAFHIFFNHTEWNVLFFCSVIYLLGYLEWFRSS